MNAAECPSAILSTRQILTTAIFTILSMGARSRHRDKVIRLILSMRLTTDDCQEALRISGRSALYPKVQRDALLIYGIENRYTVDETNQLLSAHGEDTLR